MTDTSQQTENLADLLHLLESVDVNILISTSDEVFKLLANDHRRYLIHYLTEQEDSTPLSRVAMDLTSRINDQPLTEVTPTQQERMRLRLEHEHLPRLADYGLLSWSYGDDMIDPLSSFDSADDE
jgi:hypothetical protein